MAWFSYWLTHKTELKVMDFLLLADSPTPEIALWVIGIGLLPVLGWGLSLMWNVLQIKRDNSRLLKMHEDPDSFGFGTGRTNQIIKENTRATQALTHYIQWLAKEQTGKTPPPPVEG